MKKITTRNYFLILFLYTLGIVYIMTDQWYIPVSYRLPLLLLVQISIFCIIFINIKPEKPIKFSYRLTLILAFFVIPLYIIQDLIINQNFSIKPVIITIISLLLPLMAGLFYGIIVYIQKLTKDF